VPCPDEVKRLLLAAEPGLFRIYFLTAALTGARSGELSTLTWDNVDFEEGGDPHPPDGDVGENARGPRSRHPRRVLPTQDEELAAERRGLARARIRSQALEIGLSPLGLRPGLPEAEWFADAPQAVARPAPPTGSEEGRPPCLWRACAATLLRERADPSGLPADRGGCAVRSLVAGGHDDGLRALVQDGEERRGDEPREGAL